MKWNELDEYEDEDRNRCEHRHISSHRPSMRRGEALVIRTVSLQHKRKGVSTHSESVEELRDVLLSTSPRDSSFEWWQDEENSKVGGLGDSLDISANGMHELNESLDDDIVSGVWGLSGGRKAREAVSGTNSLHLSPDRCREAGAWLGRTAASFASGVGETAATLIKRTSSLRLRTPPRAAKMAQENPPAAGAFILLPDGMRRRAWDVLGLVLLLSLLLVQAVNERWRKQHHGWLYADVQGDNPHLAYLLKIKVLLDCFYMADIFVNFRTAYQDEAGNLVKDPWKIAGHYAVHWLIFDLLCALPLDLLLDEKDLHHSARVRPGFWGWVVRRTRALAFLRLANQTTPLRFSRRLGKIVTHVRRTLRAFGGLSPALRGLHHVRQVVSLKAAMQGVRLLRSVGVMQVLSAAPLARTLMGSFTFLRLLVSVKTRGAVSALRSFLPRRLRGRQDTARGENPLVKILAESYPFSPDAKGKCVVMRSNSGKKRRIE